jgi:hypothetical protein
LFLATVHVALTRGEATRWPHGEEKGSALAHDIIELDDVRRDARRQARWRMRVGGTARFIVEPSAPGIGDGIATAGGKWRLCRAQWREVTVWRARGQDRHGGVHRRQ